MPNPVEGLPYAVFMLPAMVVWQFFSKALSMAGVSLSQNYDVVTKVFFPRLFLPFASIIAALVDLVCALAAAIVVMAVYQRGPGPAVVLAPVFIVVAIMAAVGVERVLRRVRRALSRLQARACRSCCSSGSSPRRSSIRR